MPKKNANRYKLIRQIIPNKIKPMVLIAKLADIWTNQEGYTLFVDSFKKLKMQPPTINPSSNKNSIPIWNISNNIPT